MTLRPCGAANAGELASVFSPGVAAAALLALGLLAPFGPERASALHLFPPPGPAVSSVRRDPIAALTEAVADVRAPHDADDYQSFIVHEGPHGAGKTLVIRTLLAHTPGVVFVEVPPGATTRSWMQHLAPSQVRV